MKPHNFLLFAAAIGVFSAVGTVAEAETRSFRLPSFEGYRLDYCKASGRECGERVATAWCVAQGYEYSSDWAIERDLGSLQPTISIDSGEVCRGDQCDGFNRITCSREGRSYDLPRMGGDLQGTVFTPDGRHTARAITPTEVVLTVPGCSQYEPSVLLCRSVPEYQYCRSLRDEGYVLGCRAALNLDAAVGKLIEAAEESYELSLRPRAAVTVRRGSRGDGRISGETRYKVLFEIPDHRANERCVRRTGYEYRQTGSNAGVSALFEGGSCGDPIEGRYPPEDDYLLRAYDACETRRAWGGKTEMTTDMIVAGIFHFAVTDQPATVTSLARTAAPYHAISAPLEINCRN
jgi:hypothetical protein